MVGNGGNTGATKSPEEYFSEQDFSTSGNNSIITEDEQEQLEKFYGENSIYLTKITIDARNIINGNVNAAFVSSENTQNNDTNIDKDYPKPTQEYINSTDSSEILLFIKKMAKLHETRIPGENIIDVSKEELEECIAQLLCGIGLIPSDFDFKNLMLIDEYFSQNTVEDISNWAMNISKTKHFGVVIMYLLLSKKYEDALMSLYFNPNLTIEYRALINNIYGIGEISISKLAQILCNESENITFNIYINILRRTPYLLPLLLSHENCPDSIKDLEKRRSKNVIQD